MSAKTILPAAKPLHAAMRWMLRAAGILVLAAGLDLFVFAEFTDALFAWDIEPPLTAAFLGANYLAAGVVEFGAAREATWARARAAVPAVLLFTVLTAALTVINLSSYNLHKVMAWVWFVVYFGVPPVFVLVWLKQRALPGAEPQREAILPLDLRTILGILAAAMVAFGLALALGPQWTASLWPWSLSIGDADYGSSGAAGMSAYVGVWLLSWGALLLHVIVEGDLIRVRYVFVALAVLGVLQSLALIRFRATVVWTASATIYLAVLAALVAVGILGWLASRRMSCRT